MFQPQLLWCWLLCRLVVVVVVVRLLAAALRPSESLLLSFFTNYGLRVSTGGVNH